MEKDLNNRNVNSIKRVINRKEHLSLDNIMILRVGTNDSYMVTMLGLNQDDYDDRILLSSGQREIDVIGKCLQDNLELERKSVINYMPSDYIELYNEALCIGRYDCCLTMLKGIESHINSVAKEKKEILKKLKIR